MAGRAHRAAVAGRTAAGAVVADLSSMWAGPLCARLLGLAGADVIKVESPDRPDGARPATGSSSTGCTPGTAAWRPTSGPSAGRAALKALLGAADIVIEASRPRALAALGLAPDMIPHPDGQVWLSITGYGRAVPERVAFGDDAAVAGGLVGWTNGGPSPEPVFCADAIADPLAGVCGALAVARSVAAGGGELIDLSMRDVAAAFAAAPAPAHGHARGPSGRVRDLPAVAAAGKPCCRHAARCRRRPDGAARRGPRRRHQRGARVARRPGRRMLIRNARVWPSGARLAAEPALADLPVTDVRMSGGRVTECAPRLRPAPGEPDIDAAGGALLPGLHDHHLHLRALAAARASVAAGPPDARTAGDLAARLRAADADLPPGAWLRAVGYHESVAGSLDRQVLDRLLPHRPVRVQHRTGALWMVNSAAVARLDLDGCELSGVERDEAGRPTGRLWRMDRWVADRVPAAAGDLAAVSSRAAALGITGFTDATPDATARDLASLAGAGVAQRLHCMAPAEAGPPPAITLGPVKILLDDATLPPLDDLADRIRSAHAAGRPAAVHCVTRVQLVLTLAALDAAGRLPGDRIEHAAVVPAESLPDLRGLTVVTQPHFVAERGEQYARDVPPEDLPDLWRLRSLTAAGVAVAGGSDAPFGGEDLWHAMRAAVRRPPLFRPEEAVSPARALALFLGEPAAPGTLRRVGPGQPADLVLLRAGPCGGAGLARVRPGRGHVRAGRGDLRARRGNRLALRRPEHRDEVADAQRGVSVQDLARSGARGALIAPASTCHAARPVASRSRARPGSRDASAAMSPSRSARSTDASNEAARGSRWPGAAVLRRALPSPIASKATRGASPRSDAPSPRHSAAGACSPTACNTRGPA